MLLAGCIDLFFAALFALAYVRAREVS